MNRTEIKRILENKSIREELLRHNNSYFDFRNEQIPFSELVKVRKHLLVSSLIESRVAGIFNLNYSWDTNDVKENILEFSKTIIKYMGANHLIRGAFDSILFGFIPAFVEWEISEGKIAPKKIDFASPNGWEHHKAFGKKPVIRFYDLNKTIELNEENKYNIIPIIRNKSDIFPLGEGVLEKLFWHTQYVIGGLEFWVKFSEKYGSPYIIGETPDNVEDGDISKFEDFLKKIKGLFWGLLPKGFKATILEAHGKGASSDIYKDLLNYCREDIALAVLGHTGAAVSTTGKLGGDNTAMEVRADIAISDANIIQEFVNTLIKYAVEINFGNEKTPEFKFYAEKSGKDIAERDKILHDTGARFTDEYFSDTYGIDIKYFKKEPVGADNIRPQTSDFSEPASADEAPTPANFFDNIVDSVQKIIDSFSGYSEAEKKLTAQFGSIDGTPIASMLAESLMYANFKGREE